MANPYKHGGGASKALLTSKKHHSRTTELDQADAKFNESYDEFIYRTHLSPKPQHQIQQQKKDRNETPAQ